MSPRLRPRMSPHSLRVLDIASAVGLVAAIALWLWPVSPAFDDREPAPPDTGAVPAAVSAIEAPSFAAPSSGLTATDSLRTRVIESNVFSATRRAPRTRFVMPGQAVATDPNAMIGAMEPMGSASADDSLPRLSGIIADGGDRRALLQLVAADGAPRLYRVGDVHAGYRVVRIGPDQVVLASRAGTRTLRLSQRAAPDSLEKTP